MSFKRSIFAAIVAGVSLTAAQATAQTLVVPVPNYHTIDWCAWETISESQAQEVYDQYYTSLIHVSAAIRANKAAIAELSSPGALGVLGGIALARVIGGREGALQAVAGELGGRLPKLLKFTINLTRLRQHYAIQRRIIDCMGERLEAFIVAREKRKKFGDKVPDWLPQALDRMKKVKVKLDENGRKLAEISILITPLGTPFVKIGPLIIVLPGNVTKIPGMPTTWEEVWRDNPNISWVAFGPTVAWLPVRLDENGKPYVPADWNKPDGEKTYEPIITRVYPVGDLVVPPQSARLPGTKVTGGKNLNDRGQLNQPTAGARDGDLGIGLGGGLKYKFGPGFRPTRGFGSQQDFSGNVLLSDTQLEVILRVADVGRNTRIGVMGNYGRGHDTQREGDIAGASTITSITGLNTQNIAGIKDATLETDIRTWGFSLYGKTELPMPRLTDTTVELLGGIVYENERTVQSFRQFVTGNGTNFFLHGLQSEIRSNFYGGKIGFLMHHRLPGRSLLTWGTSTVFGARKATLDLVQLPGTFGNQTVRLNDSSTSFSVRTGATIMLGHDVFDNLRVQGGVKGYWVNDVPYVGRLGRPGLAPRLDRASGGSLLIFVKARLVFGE